MSDSAPAYLTTPEVADLLRVKKGKVIGWIRRGELSAVNVGTNARSIYRVSRASLDAFLEARTIHPPAPRPPRQRRRAPTPDGGPIDPALGEELLKKGKAVKDRGKYYRVWNGVTLYF